MSDELAALVKKKLDEHIAQRPVPAVQNYLVIPVTPEQAERVLKIMESIQ